MEETAKHKEKEIEEVLQIDDSCSHIVSVVKVEEKSKLILDPNWFRVSLAVGVPVGLLWMATEAFIPAAAMIVIVPVATGFIYLPLEKVVFYMKQGKWPNPDESSPMWCNARDLMYKVTFSVAGWITGEHIANHYNLGNVAKTLVISTADAGAVMLINILNELAKPGVKAKELIGDTFRLGLTVGGAAAIWFHVGISKFTKFTLLKSLVNSIALTTEFFVGYKVLGTVPTVLQKGVSFFKELCSSRPYFPPPGQFDDIGMSTPNETTPLQLTDN